MKPYFYPKQLSIKTELDGQTDTLCEDMKFFDHPESCWVVKSGSPTDGFSVPGIVGWFCQHTGRGWAAAVLHDNGYRQRGLVIMNDLDGRYAFEPLPRKVIDILFLNAMKACGLGWVRRHIIYMAVRLFGDLYYPKKK
jgi:hypothetical protein